MTPSPQYPWLEAYPEALEETPLVRQRVLPLAVLCPDGKFLPIRLDGADGRIMLDFGEERVGYVLLEVSCAGAARLRACYGEYLDEARQAFPSPLTWYLDPEDTFEIESGHHALRSRGRRAFRYVRLTTDSPLTVTAVCVETEGYPVRDRGSFRCSDELLNKIWDISCRTTRLCMQRYYEDGIKRDGMLWIGDFRVQYLCNAMAFGDVDLARKCLFTIAASQREDGALTACAAVAGAHPYPHRIEYMPGLPEAVEHWSLMNYCTDYVSMVYEFWWHTGQTSTVQHLWPCLERLLRYIQTIDPATAKRDVDFFTDNLLHSRTALHMGLCEALRDGSNLAQLMNADAIARDMRAAYDKESSRVRDLWWDPNRRVFTDDGGGVSWHANSQSVLAGVTPAEAARELLERVHAMPDAVRPVAGFAHFHTLRALFTAGLEHLAIDWIRHDWGRVVEAGMTTCPESIFEDIRCVFHHEPTSGQGGDNDQRMTSLCHGWSAGPAYLLPAFVLGVRPTAPGFASHSQDPQLGDLEWAEGVIPTPHGELTSSRCCAAP